MGKVNALCFDYFTGQFYCVSIPYRKGKLMATLTGILSVWVYQFPIGKVNAGQLITNKAPLEKRVSIPYRKGKQKVRRVDKSQQEVSIPYRKGKLIIIYFQLWK